MASSAWFVLLYEEVWLVARTWFFLDLVSSLPLDYVFLFFDYNVVDGVGLVSQFIYH
jgi:hypothetical protein